MEEKGVVQKEKAQVGERGRSSKTRCAVSKGDKEATDDLPVQPIPGILHTY